MGTSTSIGTLIIAIALLFSAVLVGGSLSSYIEGTGDSLKSDLDQTKDIRNTNFSFDSFTYNNSTNALQIEVTNRGSKSLDIRKFDLVIDGEYTNFTYEVSQSSNRSFIESGETIIFEATVTTEPERIKVVGPFGLSKFMVP